MQSYRVSNEFACSDDIHFNLYLYNINENSSLIPMNYAKGHILLNNVYFRVQVSLIYLIDIDSYLLRIFIFKHNQ